MKKILLIAIFAISSLANSQNETTNEEYNYLNTGLDISLKNGIDLKKGYSLNSRYSTTKKGIEFNFVEFTDEKNNAKAIVAVYNYKGSKKTNYLVIPFNSPKLQELTENKLNQQINDVKTAFNQAFTEFIGALYYNSGEN